MVKVIISAIYIILCVANLSHAEQSITFEGGAAINNDLQLHHPSTRGFRGNGGLDYDGNTGLTFGGQYQFHWNDLGKSGWRAGFGGDWFQMSGDSVRMDLNTIHLDGYSAYGLAGYDHFFGRFFVGAEGHLGATHFEPDLTFVKRGRPITVQGEGDTVGMWSAGVLVGYRMGSVDAFLKAEYLDYITNPVFGSGNIEGLHRQQIKIGLRY